MIPTESLLLASKFIVAASIFFVWVVRYENIIKEFQSYGLNPQLRDFVGILKLSSSAMLFSSDTKVVLLGASLISILMMAALVTHLRIRNPFRKMVPSLTLMSFGLFIAITNA
jgi:hypothetical protein